MQLQTCMRRAATSTAAPNTAPMPRGSLLEGLMQVRGKEITPSTRQEAAEPLTPILGGGGLLFMAVFVWLG